MIEGFSLDFYHLPPNLVNVPFAYDVLRTLFTAMLTGYFLDSI